MVVLCSHYVALYHGIIHRVWTSDVVETFEAGTDDSCCGMLLSGKSKTHLLLPLTFSVLTLLQVGLLLRSFYLLNVHEISFLRALLLSLLAAA